MNVNSWMVLKSNHCYHRNGSWKAWCGNRTVTRKSSIEGFYICAVGLDILKFEQTSLFYSAWYFNCGGTWSFVSEGISPPKPLVGTVWQNFSLLFNAIDSEKYLGYAICQACKVCQTFCLQAWQRPKWCCNLLVGVALNVRFITNVMCAKNDTHIQFF